MSVARCVSSAARSLASGSLRREGRHALVFAGADGGVLRNGNWRQRFIDRAVRRVIAQDPGFPRITPHGLRHTAASLAISAGANVKAVQRMLGHKSAAMTLDT